MSDALAASYFDAERIEANPGMTFLSEAGAETTLDWIEILDENNYVLDTPSSIQDSASFLIANGHSDVDVMTTMIMLSYAAVIIDNAPE